MKLRVDVMLKEGVLDPQGKAIGHALGNLGFSGVGDVRVGKVIELDIAETDRAKAMETAKKMAENLLANLVIEDFKISTP
ncbi:MAG: phosphoribosylformylglycinamidine synthase subunit PurS [Alphaproteobacteria bacterium]|nr:phosphoribosylformylglycinamidine synthase subunit PurS [Alphaproteobacteria bacterium]